MQSFCVTQFLLCRQKHIIFIADAVLCPAVATQTLTNKIPCWHKLSAMCNYFYILTTSRRYEGSCFSLKIPWHLPAALTQLCENEYLNAAQFSPPLEHGWLLQTHIWKRKHVLDSPSESSPFHWWFIVWKERKVNQDCLYELSSIYLVIYLFLLAWGILKAMECSWIDSGWSFFSGSGLYLASACLEVRRDEMENLHPH